MVDSKIESCEEVQIKEIKDDNERLRSELKKLEVENDEWKNKYEETLEAKKFADRVILRDTEKMEEKLVKLNKEKERYKNVKALLEEELEFLIRYVDFKKDVVDLMDVDDE
ncbi:hypothetical protein F8M41_019587 [Gigaspora margarita]|uniref:Uncharacterized protein n=1 Tax=Gigaspora margarita TaxID=4874 RepID=A0A8H4EU61_GIGMA|nr:hypothetical protein F8M41_019587 [Gigaspora margarita]